MGDPEPGEDERDGPEGNPAGRLARAQRCGKRVGGKHRYDPDGLREIGKVLEAGLRCECLSLEDCLGRVDGASRAR